MSKLPLQISLNEAYNLRNGLDYMIEANQRHKSDIEYIRNTNPNSVMNTKSVEERIAELEVLKNKLTDLIKSF